MISCSCCYPAAESSAFAFPVVLDNGSGLLKAGYAGSDLPDNELEIWDMRYSMLVILLCLVMFY